MLWLFTGCSGCLAVLLGAWLAHKGETLTDHSQHLISLAVHYQFIHTLALAITLVWIEHCTNAIKRLAAWSFVGGILLFSGSLYAKAFVVLGVFGKITPLGGLLMAFGWLCLAFSSKKSL